MNIILLNDLQLKDLKLNLDKQQSDLDKFKKLVIYRFLILNCLFILLIILQIIQIYIAIILMLISYPVVLYLSTTLIWYYEELRQNRISNYLPDFLSQSSLFPKGTDIVTIIEFASKQDFGPLSKEFHIAYDQIRKGFRVEAALKEITYRNKNKFLDRTINLLITAYNSGKDLSATFLKIAKDIEKTKEIEQDKYSALAIQKYTLLLSCVILIPMVMAWIVNVISTINLNFLSENNLIGSSNLLKDYAILSIKIYIGEFAIISSIFISIIDGNWKKFIIYSIILVPFAYLIFFIF